MVTCEVTIWEQNLNHGNMQSHYNLLAKSDSSNTQITKLSLA